MSRPEVVHRHHRHLSDGRTSASGGSSRSAPSRRRGRWTAPGTCRSASVRRRSRRRRDRRGPHRTRCSRSRARRRLPAARRRADARSATRPTTRAAPSANTPAFGTPTVATSPTAYTPGNARLERLRIHWHIAILGHPARNDDIGSAVLRDAEEEVIGQLAAVVEHGDMACRVEGA